MQNKKRLVLWQVTHLDKHIRQSEWQKLFTNVGFLTKKCILIWKIWTATPKCRGSRETCLFVKVSGDWQAPWHFSPNWKLFRGLTQSIDSDASSIGNCTSAWVETKHWLNTQLQMLKRTSDRHSQNFRKSEVTKGMHVVSGDMTWH